jgi:uncharacterized OB-fold protein
MSDNASELTAQRTAVPHASPGPLTEPFWRACAEQTLRFQRCEHCAAPGFPPAEHCRQCLSTELHWETSSGHGLVYSWTVVYRAATPVFETPYAPAIVTLDEGYQMLTNLIGATPSTLRVGLPVQVDFRKLDDGLWLPYFRPVP